jgi:hypothetical protein
MSIGYGPQHNPNDSPRDGTIHVIAREILESFTNAARRWPLREVWREDDNNNTRHGMACSYCDQIIYFISDSRGILFDYSDDELLLLTVAHVRQIHERIVTRGSI